MGIHPVFRPPNALPFDIFFGWTTKVVLSILGGVLYLESSSKFLGLMSPWYEHPADSSRMMIPAYQNDLQMFPIFRMQFASLNDLCMALRSNVKKLDLRANISGCASYGAVSRISARLNVVLLTLDSLIFLQFLMWLDVTEMVSCCVPTSRPVAWPAIPVVTKTFTRGWRAAQEQT